MVGRCISHWNSPFLGYMLVFGSVPPPPFFVNRYNSPGRLASCNFSRSTWGWIEIQNAHLWSWFQEIPWGHFEAQETWHDSSCKLLQNDLKIADVFVRICGSSIVLKSMFLLDVMVGWFHVLLCFSCKGGAPPRPPKKSKVFVSLPGHGSVFLLSIGWPVGIVPLPCTSGSYTLSFLLLIPKKWFLQGISLKTSLLIFDTYYSCHDDKALGLQLQF